MPPWRRGPAYDAVRTAASTGPPTGRAVPVYVGDTLTARHVVLALPDDGRGDALLVYDPASGRDVPVTREAWVTGTLRLSGWDRPWFVLRPAARRTRA